MCLPSPPSTRGSPRGPWVHPHTAQGWGGLPANPGDSTGAAGLSQRPAVPTPALGHVPPIPRGPHGVLSTSVTQTLGCRFGSSSPAMGSAELLWPVGVWSHPPLSPPELASVEGPREPPDQPRNHTRGCVRRQGGLQGWSAGLEPEAACGSLLLMPAGQRPQFRFSRGNGVRPQGGRVASQKHAYDRQPEPLRATDTWPEPDPAPPVRAKTAARPPSTSLGLSSTVLGTEPGAPKGPKMGPSSADPNPDPHNTRPLSRRRSGQRQPPSQHRDPGQEAPSQSRFHPAGLSRLPHNAWALHAQSPVHRRCPHRGHSASTPPLGAVPLGVFLALAASES